MRLKRLGLCLMLLSIYLSIASIFYLMSFGIDGMENTRFIGALIFFGIGVVLYIEGNE